MRKFIFKSGFTLVELMVFFIFISLVMAAATPIITKRVKDLPIKIHHGKFICYGGHYEMYNSTKLISSGSGCQFTPPKRASLFKIELVGAGAGGFSYTDFWEDNETRTGGYKLGSGYYGDGYTDIDEGTLRYMLENAPFTYVKTGTSGTSGESVSLSYVGIGSPHIDIVGSCQGDCWSDHWGDWYPCTKYHDVPKTDEEGNVLKDEEGNILYDKNVPYESECRDWLTNNPTNNPASLIECSICSLYRAKASSMASEISGQRNCGPIGDEWCYTVATNNFISSYRDKAALIGSDTGNYGVLNDFGAGYSETGYPERGGYAQNMYIDGLIDFCDWTNVSGGTAGAYTRADCQAAGGRYIENEEIKSYLGKLFGSYYQKGSSNALGSCAGWGYTEMKQQTRTNLSGHDLSGENGKDVMHYDAMKAWGEKCTTNSWRARGGRGGWIDDHVDTITGSNSTSSPIQSDKDAKDRGVTGVVNGPYKVKAGTATERIPEIQTSTTLNVRHHQVGVGGGSGSYRVAYVSSLDDDCVFNVASGGSPIGGDPAAYSESLLENLHANLSTSLVCNDGTLRLSAAGGYYNASISHTAYPGFNYINPDGSTHEPPSFNTSSGGGSSPYNPSDIFTKYVLAGHSFGAGGSGSSISDSCTKPWGDYWIKRVYNGSADKSIHNNFPQDPCDESGVSTSGASSGNSGVIIISW